MLVGRKKYGPLKVLCNGIEIHPKPFVKYLGVIFDEKLTFKEHILQVTCKAERTLNALTGLMPKIGGATECKRRILASVMDSIMLYATPV